MPERGSQSREVAQAVLHDALKASLKEMLDAEEAFKADPDWRKRIWWRTHRIARLDGHCDLEAVDPIEPYLLLLPYNRCPWPCGTRVDAPGALFCGNCGRRATHGFDLPGRLQAAMTYATGVNLQFVQYLHDYADRRDRPPRPDPELGLGAGDWHLLADAERLLQREERSIYRLKKRGHLTGTIYEGRLWIWLNPGIIAAITGRRQRPVLVAA
jgi:hypothetical protein